MRYKIILNPQAGRGYGERALPEIRQRLSAQGLDYDLAVTRQAGEAANLARQAVLDGYGTVVAAGGDGTYQEVINGMLAAHEGQSAADDIVVGDLGVLPLGSGCDFAWMAGIPPDLEGACARLAGRQTKVVDLARVTVDGVPRYFDNTVGIGFEGVVTVEAPNFKYLRGMALYLPLVLKSIFLTLKPARSVIEYEDEGQMRRLEGAFLMIDVCNGGRAGSAFMVAPQARTDDGLLDLCLVEDISRLKMLALVPRFLKGTHVHDADVATMRSRHVVVTSPDDLMAHADGELLCTAAHRIECEIVPQKMRVVC